MRRAARLDLEVPPDAAESLADASRLSDSVQPSGQGALVGLQRRGFSRNDIHDLRRAYRLLFAAEGTLVERMDDVAQEFAGQATVQEILEFIRAGGKRSLCTPKEAAEA